MASQKLRRKMHICLNILEAVNFLHVNGYYHRKLCLKEICIIKKESKKDDCEYQAILKSSGFYKQITQMID